VERLPAGRDPRGARSAGTIPALVRETIIATAWPSQACSGGWYSSITMTMDLTRSRILDGIRVAAKQGETSKCLNSLIKRRPQRVPQAGFAPKHADFTRAA